MNEFLRKLDLKNIFEGVVGNAIFWVFLTTLTLIAGVCVWLVVRFFRRPVFIKRIHGWQFYQQGPTRGPGVAVVSGWQPNSLLFDFTAEIRNNFADAVRISNAHVLSQVGSRAVNDCEIESGDLEIPAHSTTSVPISSGFQLDEFREHQIIDSVWFQAVLAGSGRTVRKRVRKGPLPHRQDLEASWR
jgi:hypothetical protein